MLSLFFYVSLAKSTFFFFRRTNICLQWCFSVAFQFSILLTYDWVFIVSFLVLSLELVYLFCFLQTKNKFLIWGFFLCFFFKYKHLQLYMFFQALLYLHTMYFGKLYFHFYSHKVFSNFLVISSWSSGYLGVCCLIPSYLSIFQIALLFIS